MKNVNEQLSALTPWYLAASKPRQEARAVKNLLNQGINAYSPIVNIEKIRASKKIVVTEAMFTGYVFVNLKPEDGLWHKVKSTRGIRDWVRFSNKVAQLPEGLVERFIEIASDPNHNDIKKYFVPGEPVRILSGPFQGMKGIYKASSGEERAMILIEFLGQVNKLHVTNDQIQTE